MLISANINCEPILAILDETNESFESTLNIKDLDNPLTPFLLSAIKYNEDPTYFDDHQQAEKTSYSFNKKAAVGGLGRNGKVIASEIHPRVQVQWGQSEDPYTRYTPNNWHAGCVATVIAQAMSVTRHIGEFNRIPLNWDKLIKMKNSNYRNQYPEEANTIGLLMREIGRAVNMDYGAQGSGARTKLGVEILEIGKQFYSLNNKGAIKLILDESPNNIIIISSRDEKSSWIGVPRGTGHAYIVDGYQLFTDGTDLMHVNYGWDRGRYNGYYSTRIWAPYFTDDAPAKFPHKWEFFCIRKRF
ncbi:putative pyrogenic exotoxin B [Sphingobacterium deserti]|uniref:Putative pyrogenic exotoxin B n=2 Tax=Sphingobacterium deserti TaxID=1229276 RepID=A0A0B8T6C7_9SPHI|nr:putative pyrogenic exotoxin B [Sphingobacterium deserti]